MREPPVLQHRKINHLPYNIILSILRRLLVKLVIRFKCISKTLDSSITSPDFIYTHLNQNNNNYNKDDDDHRYLIHMPVPLPCTNRSVCTVAFDRNFDKVSEIQIPKDICFKGVQIVGLCNGLLCLIDNDNHIYLWKPGIKKFKNLPVTCLGMLINVTLGFAYHSENNDNKVVRISCSPWLSAMCLSGIEVYMLSSDSRRRVRIATNGTYYFQNDLFPTPLVCGALHWMALIIEGEHTGKSMIMSFDVNSEEFRKLSLPHGSTDANTFYTCLALFKGETGFNTHGRSEQLGVGHSIWVMREYGVAESWNKICFLPYERLSDCSVFTDCGSLLIFRDFLTEPKNPKSKYEFLSVETETVQEKKDPDIQYPSLVATFMENLVLLDGANMVSY